MEELFMVTQGKKGMPLVSIAINLRIVRLILTEYKALVIQCRMDSSFQIRQRKGKQFAYCSVLRLSKTEVAKEMEYNMVICRVQTKSFLR